MVCVLYLGDDGIGWRGRGIEGGPVGLPQHEGLVLEGGRGGGRKEVRGERERGEKRRGGREGGRKRHHRDIMSLLTSRDHHVISINKSCVCHVILCYLPNVEADRIHHCRLDNLSTKEHTAGHSIGLRGVTVG